jgi:hypothetical protein
MVRALDLFYTARVITSSGGEASFIHSTFDCFLKE